MLLGSLALSLAAFSYGLVAVAGTSRKTMVHLEEEACEQGDGVGALQTRLTIAQIAVVVLGLVIVGVMTYVVAASSRTKPPRGTAWTTKHEPDP